MKHLKLTVFLWLLLILSGCATVAAKNHFFGISMNSVRDAKDFDIVSDTEEGIKFNKNDRTMNPDIYAWARVDGPYVLISVTNNAKKPIDTNYFSDDFELTDKDGRTYKMEKLDISLYPQISYINPGRTAKFLLENPFYHDNKDFNNQTAVIVCTLGSLFNRVTIVLKPIPEEQNTFINKK